MAIDGDSLSDEVTLASGLRLVYRLEGPADAPLVLLIMGLGCQLSFWPDEFIQSLHQAGYRTLRFDNRDSGLSSQCPAGNWPGIWKTWLRARLPLFRPPPTPYTLMDMAGDAAALLEVLHPGPVHVLGVSMGGMIAQLLVAHWPDRSKSLVSIMSSSQRRGLPGPTLRVQRAMLQPPPRDREGIIRYSMTALRAIGSPGYPPTDAQLRALVTRNVDRAFRPAGTRRQLLAILSSGDRVAALKCIRVPSLVIHGVDDPLIPVAAGKDTARWIPGARLVLIPGMGHDLSPALMPVLLAPIYEHLAGLEPSVRGSG